MYLEMKKICINCYTPSAYKEGRVYTLNIGHLSVLREYEVLVRVQCHDVIITTNKMNLFGLAQVGNRCKMQKNYLSSSS